MSNDSAPNKQVFTGKLPYSSGRSARIQHQVLCGLRPERPLSATRLGLTNPVWSIMERGWKADRRQRPSIGRILTVLEREQIIHQENTGSKTSQLAAQHAREVQPPGARTGKRWQIPLAP